MPHINMKHFPSLSNEQRNELADIFIQGVMAVAGCPKNVISVAFQSVEPESWMQDVYHDDILKNKTSVHIFPDYKISEEAK
ncbi:tautomerase PptA [Pantoea agglomerans]|uniref:tautomerase PptA n=1 Tax=Enterobacter agglomerans TaxID=549 RepID=UPI003DA0B995